MKLKKYMLAILSCCLLAGCASKPVEEEKPEIKPAKVVVQYFEDADVKEEDCTQITHMDGEYASKIVIQTNQTIRDVQLLNVEMGTVTDDDTYYFVKNVIYKTKKMTKDEPLLVTTEFPNFMPQLVLSYTDTNDKEKKVSIGMSGKDSSLVVAPARLEKEKKQEKATEEKKEAKKESEPEIRQYGEDIPVGPYEVVQLMIGSNAAGFQSKEVFVEAEFGMYPALLIQALEDETQWKLSGHVEEAGINIYVDFDDSSCIVTGPPMNQVDAYRVYDQSTLVDMALNSIKATICTNYNPNANIYFSLNGQDFVVDGVTYAKDVAF